jgi:2,3-bisphosphoglycerate-independent phosphoglycerate mutase|nr:MAG: peptidase [Bacteroidota bacterium]
MKHIYLLFIDGLGLGPAGAANPLDADYPALRFLAGGQRWTQRADPIRDERLLFLPLDAGLDVPGLPQSGTGQTSLMTGRNGAQLMGRHFGPWAPRMLWPLIDRENLLYRLRLLGFPVQFVNAYPPVFFEQLRRTQRWSVMSRSAHAAGLRLKGVADVLAGRALTAEMTGQAWRERLGIPIPLLDPRQAGRRWHALGREVRLSLYEHYLLDRAGHAQDILWAQRELQKLDRFLQGWLECFDAERDLLLVTSDHGNVEDLSTRGHTRNPVPLLAFGAGVRHWAQARRITDLVPPLLEAASALTPFLSAP